MDINYNKLASKLHFELYKSKDRIKQLEDEIAEWKLKYIDVCEKKDLLEGKE